MSTRSITRSCYLVYYGTVHGETGPHPWVTAESYCGSFRVML